MPERSISPLKWNNSICLQVGEMMKTLKEYANFGQSVSTCPPYPFQPGDWVNLGTWKTSLQGQLTPKWSRSHLVIWTTHSALKLQRVASRVLRTQVKSIPTSWETTWSKEPPWLPFFPWSFSSENWSVDQGDSGHSSEPPHQGTLSPMDKRPRNLHF